MWENWDSLLVIFENVVKSGTMTAEHSFEVLQTQIYLYSIKLIKYEHDWHSASYRKWVLLLPCPISPPASHFSPKVNFLAKSWVISLKTQL